MLFLPWRNEEQDLYGGYKTLHSQRITHNTYKKKYEKYKDSLDLAIEEVEKDQFDDMYNDIDTTILNNELSQSGKDDYGFFDPD